MKAVRLLRATYQSWQAHNPSRQAAALAFFAVFSLAPLLMLALALAAWLLGEQAAQGQMAEQLERLIGSTPAHLLQDMVRSAAFHRSGLLVTVVAGATLLYGASNVFAQVQEALNEIWSVTTPDPLTWGQLVHQRLADFFMVGIVGIVLLVSVLASTLFNAVAQWLPERAPWALSLATSILSLMVLLVLFAMLYRILPETRIEWRDVWIGATFTTLLFTMGKGVMSWYLGRYAINSPYGPAGSVLAILLFSYYSAQVFLFGAEFTHLFAQERRSHDKPSEASRPGSISADPPHEVVSGHLDQGQPGHNDAIQEQHELWVEGRETH